MVNIPNTKWLGEQGFKANCIFNLSIIFCTRKTWEWSSIIISRLWTHVYCFPCLISFLKRVKRSFVEVSLLFNNMNLQVWVDFCFFIFYQGSFVFLRSRKHSACCCSHFTSLISNNGSAWSSAFFLEWDKYTTVFFSWAQCVIGCLNEWIIWLSGFIPVHWRVWFRWNKVRTFCSIHQRLSHLKAYCLLQFA